METPEDLKYSEEHEWVRMDGDVATVGITAYARTRSETLSSLSCRRRGARWRRAKASASSSPSRRSRMSTALSLGEIVEVNNALENAPEQVNGSPYGDGWMIRIRVTDTGALDKLMSASEYTAFTAH